MPFDFSNPSLGRGTRFAHKAEEMTMLVSGPAWSYSCVFAPSPEPATPCVVRLRALVQNGSVSIGTLVGSGRYFLDEAVLSAGREWQDVSLEVPALPSRGAFVVRTCTDTPSRTRLRIVSVEESEGVDPEQAVDEFLAAGEVMLGECSDRQLQVGRSSEVLRKLLKDAASASGMWLLEPADGAFDEWTQALTDNQLVTLARSQLVPATAAPFAGWHFDWALTQPAPRWQIRAAIWRAMAERCGDVELELPWLENTLVRMPLRSDLSLPLFTLGQFEPNICNVLAPMMQPGDTFIDIGANEGLYTLLAAARVEEAGKVVAIEPSPREFERLCSNIESNSFSSRTVVIDQALGSEAGWASFAVAAEEHGGQNAFVDLIAPNISIAQVRATPLLTLDMIAARLQPRRIDFVKLDVEGAEVEVVEGGMMVLEEHRPIWIAEVGRSGSPSRGTVERLFRDNNYRIFVIDDQLGRAVPLADDAAMKTAENIFAVPPEHLAQRWPNAPTS